jgi:alkylhydroperoxidase family enzyme
MTWLPLKVEGQSERDALLGLYPEAYARHREFLEATTAATDAELLEAARARMAQMLVCREELARHSPERLAELEQWERSESLTAKEKAALAFVEQFVLDPSLVSTELLAPLEEELGTTGVINFTTAIAAHEASIRLAAVLDLEPAP